MTTASRVTEQRTGGNVNARRLTDIGVGEGGQVDLNPNANMRNFWCQNVGANKLLIRFDGQAAPQHVTLEAGKALPITIQISPSTVINFRSDSGTTDVECILWG